MQPRGFSHQQVHYFRLAPPSRDIQGRFTWELQLTFELILSYVSLEWIAVRTAEFVLAHLDVKDMDEV